MADHDDRHPDEQLRDFLAAEHLRLSKPEHPEPRQVPLLANYLGGIQAALDHLRTQRLADTRTASAPTIPSGRTPCRRSTARDRWECITWPGMRTVYPCVHDHAHCDYIGCVEHIDGMHVDFRGDAIVHIGCHLCGAPGTEA